ncbi:MAG: HupE/UreJ family protein [Bryobacterales bacterium]|nr:HupE/UreJ family protein [Acidobacteriota bacterium]MCB9383036.1 HupE/UreJ family protein [Bryobacterales bacterium]
MRGLPACAWLALLLPFAAPAHDFQFTQIVVVLSADGAYQADVAADVDALALGLDPATDSAVVAERMSALSPAELDQAVEHARRNLSENIEIRFDGQAEQADVTFPQHGTPAARAAEIPTVLGTLARFSGRVPEGAREVTVRAGEEFKIVQLTVFDPAQSGQTAFTLDPGATSPPYQLGGGEQTSAQNVYWRYIKLGFEHILPKGLDHILFVLGLFLLSTRLRPLLWQITAFTVAHSVTLALSMFGVVSLPSRLVESMIALSIAYVAIENLFTSKLTPWRTTVVFCFGLLHGLGFAGVLRELGLPRNQFVPALVSFNVGVELGQLTVVGLAFAFVGRFRNHPLYRKAVVIPASLAIAATGIYWAVERAFL